MLFSVDLFVFTVGSSLSFTSQSDQCVLLIRPTVAENKFFMSQSLLGCYSFTWSCFLKQSPFPSIILAKCVFVTDQSRLTGIAKVLLKICKQEMSEIENCPDCYLNAHIRKDSWFIEVCVSIEAAMKSVFRNFMQCHIGICMVCGSFVSPAQIQFLFSLVFGRCLICTLHSCSSG